MISGSAVTTCCSACKVKFCLNSKSPIARDNAKLPDISNGRHWVLTVHTTKFDKATGSSDACRLLLVGGLVIIGQRLCFTLVPKNTARVSGICLRLAHLFQGNHERTTIIRPSGVMRATTAVQPEGSLKKLGSEGQQKLLRRSNPPARRSSSLLRNACFNAAS